MALFPVLLVDLFGVDSIERSLGMCMGLSSFAFLVAAPISGKIMSKSQIEYYTPGKLWHLDNKCNLSLVGFL